MRKQFRGSPLFSVCVISVFVFFISISPAFGQAGRGTITGSVIDEAGSFVPNATIDLIDVETGLLSSFTSNLEGNFSISFLRPGGYRITIGRIGFTTSEIRDLRLNAGDRVRLTVKLRVGQSNEVVEVPADSLEVQTRAGETVTTIIPRELAGEVPLNGRSFQSLALLAPGVVQTVSSLSGDYLSVNGQRTSSNYFTVDGVSANVGSLGPYSLSGQSPATNTVGSTASLVSIDAVQEMSVGQNRYSAEFGRSTGGQFSVTTRSGSNRFTGSVFEYFRNDALDANDWFANANGITKPPLRLNDYGGVVGGPIIRDKTFFFFSYEGLRLRQPRVANSTVPSLSLRESAPSVLRPLLDAYPLPTGANVSPSRARYVASFSDPRTMDATSIRVDHSLSKSATVFARINYAPSEGSVTTLSSVAVTDSRAATYTFGSNQSFGSRYSNELRINISRSRSGTVSDIEEIGGAVRPPDSLMFKQPFAQPETSWFTFAIDGAAIRVSQNSQQQRQFNLIDNFSIFRGRHQIRLGFDHRLLTPITRHWDYALNITTTPSLLALARASRATVSASLSELFPRYTNFSAYLQDTWQANRRLTVTYGVRWDINPPPAEKNGNYPYSTIGGFDPDEMTFAPGVYPFWKTRYSNLAPRVGASYLLSHQTGWEMVLRSGFGVFYDIATGNSSVAMRPFLYPYSATRTLTNVSIPLSDANAAPPGLSLLPPYQNLFVFDKGLETPRTFEWSVGIEQALGRGQSLSLSSVNVAGRKLISDHYLSSPHANFSRMHIIRATGTSDYRSLQVKFQRTSKRGPNAIVSYTFGRSFDTASEESAFGNSADPEELQLERAPSDFDVRHSLSAGFTYQMPRFTRGTVVPAIVNGWSVSGIVTTRSAMPIVYIQANSTICEGSFCFVDCDQLGNSSCPRPDLVAGVPIYLLGSQYPGGKRLNPAAFATPPAGRQGTLGRNALRGFTAFQIDFSLQRSFRVRERLVLQLTAELFNATNRPNFAGPDSFLYGEPELDQYSFGIATQMLGSSLVNGSAGLNSIYQFGRPRSVQLAARLRF